MTIIVSGDSASSLQTYDGLKTAVAAELNRTDLSAKVADWVLMGESRLNRDLRMVDMIVTQTGTLSTTARTLALPNGFLEKVQFRLTNPLKELVWTPPMRLMEHVGEELQAGQPRFYSVLDTIQFDRIPDAEYPYAFAYFEGYQLTDDADTNYLLTSYPQAYLFAACMYGAMYLKDRALAHEYDGLLALEIRSIKRAEAKRLGASESRLVTELSKCCSYNIHQG